MDPQKSRTEACPIEELMDVIGGRWKVFILWRLIEEPLRSTRLRESIPPISQKVLIEQLRELERDGLVVRRIYPSVPPRVEYEATPLGKSLHSILEAMCHWTSEHVEEIRAARQEDHSKRQAGETATGR
jgi:DNA-binding HxlR family transcriptional regulator